MNDGRQSLRTFFAIWPDDTVRAELWQRAAFAAKACGGRATRSDLLHLTLVFIGTTSRDRVADLVSLMDTIDTPAFVLDLDCSGWFRQNGIVWAGTRSTSEPLIALHASLASGAERLGFSLDVRPYAPHLTLARDATRSPPPGPMPSLPWRVGSFVLVQSKPGGAGPRYEILRERALPTASPRLQDAEATVNSTDDATDKRTLQTIR